MNTMRVLPALFRSFSSHNNVHNTQTKSLNHIINKTADRLVNGGFWKKIEPPVQKTPLEAFIESLHQFNNRCRANSEEFARTSLEPIRVSCMETYSKTVSQVQNNLENLANLAERSALQYAISRQAARETIVEKKQTEEGTTNLTLTENCPLRKGVISAVRVMADIILPPRDTYREMGNYGSYTIH